MVIRTKADVMLAWRQARALALSQGFDRADAEAVALSASELAANLGRYAPGGTLGMAVIEEDGRVGIQLASRDAGPGIADVGRAMQDGYSTSGGMGSGLPSVKRLMDEFTIDTGAGGTTIVARKWRRPR